MRLHAKLTLYLLVALVAVVAAIQAVQLITAGRSISEFSRKNSELFKSVEEKHALNIFRSVSQAVQGSIQRGEMEKFVRLVSSQKEIEGLLEFSLFSRTGIVTHSSEPSALGKRIPKEISARLETDSNLLINQTNDAIEIFQPQISTADCVRCHVGWKMGETGGTTYFKFSKAALAMLEQQGQKSISMVSRRTIMTSLGAIPAVVIVFGIISWLITRKIFSVIDRTISSLREANERFMKAANQISEVSANLAEGASEQAASIEETSSSMEEMSSMTIQNADNAEQANKLMTGTRDAVTRASRSMANLTASMVEISRAGEETSKIIRTIDEIAFQTNLLALNAAVEAARAGEAGAGFAVVADEVRNLALRAAEAARNTASLIEGTVKKVMDGSELVEKTEKEFVEVSASVVKSAELVGEISAASREQALGIEQINKAVGEMDRVVQQNAANAEESAAASDGLNIQAERVKEFVTELQSLVDGSNADR